MNVKCFKIEQLLVHIKLDRATKILKITSIRNPIKTSLKLQITHLNPQVAAKATSCSIKKKCLNKLISLLIIRKNILHSWKIYSQFHVKATIIFISL